MVTLSSSVGAIVVGASPIEGAPTGSQVDLVNRMMAVLPTGWFPDTAPVLSGVLNGVASIWASLYAMLQFVITQARIATATGVVLDMVAVDFFGTSLTRAGMSDTSFRSAILRRILRQGGVRAGMIAELAALTSNTPTLIESERPADTGVLGGGNVGIGYAGGGTGYSSAQASSGAGYWGTRVPMQSFIQIAAGTAAASDVYAAVSDMKPAGSDVWVHLA